MIFEQTQSQSGKSSTFNQMSPPPIPSKSAPRADAIAGTCGSAACCSPTHEQLALAAYDIYLAHGRAEGRTLANWLQAEEELAQTQRAFWPHASA